jgi:chemotaxis protein CheD
MDIFVKMSEIVIGKEEQVLRTVVGSCIALCLWDKKVHIGGMVHIMLPHCNGDYTASEGKYADRAVNALITRLIRKGAKIENLIATCVGGASMFQKKKTSILTIGECNLKVVKDQLIHHEISIVTESIGGTMGKKVVFHCFDGRVIILTLSR